MHSAKLFNKNLKRWVLVCPEGASRLKNMSCTHISFCQTASGALNLMRKHGTQVDYLHHPNDPQAEAARWFKALPLKDKDKDTDVIFVFGVGLGYYYEAAREWLHQNERRAIVFFETDPEVVHRLLETERGTVLVNDRQVALHLVEREDPIQPAISPLIQPYAPFNCVVSCLVSYSPRFKLWFNSISFFIALHKGAGKEYQAHGILIIKNFIENYLDLSRSYLADELFGKFKNVPAIICGAGPSLDNNIDLLATLGDRALIFAGGTALNALNARGVMPHFGLGIDPNPAQFTRILANHAYELPFLYRSRMSHEAFEIVHGDRLYVTGTIGYGLGEWMEQKLGFAQEEVIEEGFNVLNFSLVLAHAMGCNPIICVGIDLAYSRGKPYASGMASHPIHDFKDHFRTKEISEELISKDDIFGKPVVTLWKWISEAGWYTIFASQHPEMTLINATEGGIGFDRIPNMPLAEVKSQYLGKQYDIYTRLQGEIQNSMLPSTVTAQSTRECLTLVAESLKACIGHCQEIINALSQSLAKTPDQEMEADKGIRKAIRKLENEEAYQAILKVFNKDYLAADSLPLNRLKFDQGLLPVEETERKKKRYAINRYQKLTQTAKIQAGLFQYVLDKRTNDEKVLEKNLESSFLNPKELYPLPQPTSEEIYTFDGQTLTIIDPELGLNIKEAFKPGADQKICLYYPDGALKFEQFYREGLLHGPSTFYSQNGAILAQAWFLDGRRQGKMHTYYASGNVHSVQRFRDDLKEGLQQYYYPDALPKSMLPYAEGKLHGDVLLYHYTGLPARKLHFVHGKRDGLEQIWDEFGRALVEAGYHDDRPFGLAQQWYPNGALVAEIVYDDSSNPVAARKWNLQGQLLPPEEPKPEDNYEIKNLMRKKTESADDLLKEQTKIMSTIVTDMQRARWQVSTLSDQTTDTAVLTAEVQRLQKQMERMHVLNNKLQGNPSGNDIGPNEQPLKTALTKQEMELQLESLHQQLGQELNIVGKLLASLKPSRDPNV